MLLGAPNVDRAVGKGILTRAEGLAWLEHLEELQRQDRFFSTLGGYLVAGRC